MAPRTARTRPLEGVVVVAVEQAVAAPFATRQLADLGARVIKIERPGGDFARAYDRVVHGTGSHFAWLNRSKESVVLDLAGEAGARDLRSLIARADVLIQNLAPGAVERLGFDLAELRVRHPRLITVSVSGYGPGGPFSGRKAYDLIVQADSGLLSITGTPEEPTKIAIPVVDIAAGMYAYSGVLTALIQRQRTGSGTHLEISMLEAVAEWMGYPLNYIVEGGGSMPRNGSHHATIAPYGVFPAQGGELLMAIQNDREWRRFCTDVLQRPDAADDPRFVTNTVRVEHRVALHEMIEQIFAAVPLPVLLQRLDTAGIANSELRSVASLANHPQLLARDRWRSVRLPAGRVRSLLPPATPVDAEPVMGPVPEIGEHTAAVLAELAAPPAPHEPAPHEPARSEPGDPTDVVHTDLLPTGPDHAPYRLVTSEGVSTVEANGRRFLVVAPGALRRLAQEAVHDVLHFLRPAHLAQLRRIIDDPEVSADDRVVALDLLENAGAAAAGGLPLCEDTDTAIVMGKRGQNVLTEGEDEKVLARGIVDAYATVKLRHSQLAPLSMGEDHSTGSDLPAQIELYAADGDTYEFLFLAKGGGSADKPLLFQEAKAVLNEAAMMRFLEEKIGALGTAACPPYHLAIVVGGTSAEFALETARYAAAHHLDELPTAGSESGHGFHDRAMEEKVFALTRRIGPGARFGGKYFCHDVRVIRLPRHAGSCPVAIAVSCSADRQARARITADGVFLEELERDPARFLPDITDEHLPGDGIVEID